MEIALRVRQFWSEIKLVITNRTPATRSCDFLITRLISDQIALHPVQLPLYIMPVGYSHLLNGNAHRVICFACSRIYCLCILKPIIITNFPELVYSLVT